MCSIANIVTSFELKDWMPALGAPIGAFIAIVGVMLTNSHHGRILQAQQEHQRKQLIDERHRERLEELYSLSLQLSDLVAKRSEMLRIAAENMLPPEVFSAVSAQFDAIEQSKSIVATNARMEVLVTLYFDGIDPVFRSLARHVAALSQIEFQMRLDYSQKKTPLPEVAQQIAKEHGGFMHNLYALREEISVFSKSLS